MVPRLIASLVFGSVLLGTLVLTAQNQQTFVNPNDEIGSISIVAVDSQRTRVTFAAQGGTWVMEAESMTVSYAANGITIKGTNGTLASPRGRRPLSFGAGEFSFLDGRFHGNVLTSRP
jgi:hypothetical protein